MTEKPNVLSGDETRVSLLQRMSDPRQRADAWNQFLERYANLILAWCRHWGVDASIDEDVLQETMLRVLNSIDFFERRRSGSFRRWLRELAHSSWVLLKREEQRQMTQRKATEQGKRSWNGLTSDKGYEHLAALCDSWANRELLEMAAERVRDRVSGDTWRTYEMLAAEHRSVEDVADLCGISIPQAYNRLFRVRRYLKQEFEALDAEPF